GDPRGAAGAARGGPRSRRLSAPAAGRARLAPQCRGGPRRHRPHRHRQDPHADGATHLASNGRLEPGGRSPPLPLEELIDAEPPTTDRPISLTVTRRARGPERLASGAPEAALATAVA